MSNMSNMNKPTIQGKVIIPVWRLLVLGMFIGICIYDGQYLLAAAVLFFAAEKLETTVTMSALAGVCTVLDLLNMRDSYLEARIDRLEIKHDTDPD